MFWSLLVGGLQEVHIDCFEFILLDINRNKIRIFANCRNKIVTIKKRQLLIVHETGIESVSDKELIT